VLKRTFCHLQGIGTGTEQRLWESGLHDWEQALGAAAALPVPPSRGTRMRAQLAESVARLAAREVGYFARCLPAREHWRLFAEFRNLATYLDIETTGLGPAEDSVTTVVTYGGGQVRHFVQGRNLDALPASLADCQLLVTYNGKSFDLPFLRRTLGVADVPAHIDLRHVLGSLGLRGGLKRCERQLGLDRGDLADVDGYFAVLLWRAYRASGNERVLQTLLAYNALDVLNLEPLMVRAYNLRLAGTPFAGQELPLPAPVANPFTAHADVVAAVRRTAGWS
jgi:hypothetical protein